MDGEISTDEVNALLEDKSDETVRIVDIRNKASFAHSRIPGSENVPFQELTSRIDEFEDADRIVTVCPHGKASVQAAQLIGSYEGSADATVESMAGGSRSTASSTALPGRRKRMRTPMGMLTTHRLVRNRHSSSWLSGLSRSCASHHHSRHSSVGLLCRENGVVGESRRDLGFGSRRTPPTGRTRPIRTRRAVRSTVSDHRGLMRH